MDESVKGIDSLPTNRDLLREPATQDALKLTASQRAAVAKAIEKGEEAWRNRAARPSQDPTNPPIRAYAQNDGGRGAAIRRYLEQVPLTVEQLRALKRLPVQRAGARVVWEAGVSDALKLTREQLETLNERLNALSLQRFNENESFGKRHQLKWYPGGKTGRAGWILSELSKQKRERVEHWVASRDAHYDALKWKALAAALSAQQHQGLVELLGYHPF
jgi:hypothetical protein